MGIEGHFNEKCQRASEHRYLHARPPSWLGVRLVLRQPFSSVLHFNLLGSKLTGYLPILIILVLRG